MHGVKRMPTIAHQFWRRAVRQTKKVDQCDQTCWYVAYPSSFLLRHHPTVKFRISISPSRKIFWTCNNVLHPSVSRQSLASDLQTTYLHQELRMLDNLPIWLIKPGDHFPVPFGPSLFFQTLNVGSSSLSSIPSSANFLVHCHVSKVVLIFSPFYSLIDVWYNAMWWAYQARRSSFLSYIGCGFCDDRQLGWWSLDCVRNLLQILAYVHMNKCGRNLVKMIFHCHEQHIFITQ